MSATDPVPSGESETLEERLRNLATLFAGRPHSATIYAALTDAAGEIARLRAEAADEIARLAAEVARCQRRRRAVGQVAIETIAGLEAEVARLTAERDNIKANLATVLTMAEDLQDRMGRAEWARDDYRAEAARYREALEAAEARAAQLEEALVALDDTCDEVVGALTHAVYEAMLDAGMEDALDALDSARRDAVSLIQHTEAFRPVQEKRYARIRALTNEGGDRAND